MVAQRILQLEIMIQPSRAIVWSFFDIIEVDVTDHVYEDYLGLSANLQRHE